MIDQPGAYQITNAQYHSDPCVVPSLSRGLMMDLLFKSPAHAFANHPRFTVQKPDNDKKYDIGQSAHSLFLEGIDKCVIVDADDWRKKEAKEQRDQAYQDGLIPLLKSQYEDVGQMVRAANTALYKSELRLKIKDGVSESSLFWKEGKTWFRIRTDWMKTQRPIILDYKTSDSANPDDFGRKAISLGYDIQESLYRRGFEAIYGLEPTFVFMVQEIKKPYLCSFIALSPEFQYHGDNKVKEGIRLWRECIETGEWPGYPKRICHIDPPPWVGNWEIKAEVLEDSI